MLMARRADGDGAALLPRWLRTATAYGVVALVAGGVLWFVLQVLTVVSLVVGALATALLVTALASPLNELLRRLGVPRVLAAFVSVLVLLASPSRWACSSTAGSVTPSSTGSPRRSRWRSTTSAAGWSRDRCRWTRSRCRASATRPWRGSSSSSRRPSGARRRRCGCSERSCSSCSRSSSCSRTATGCGRGCCAGRPAGTRRDGRRW